MNDRRFTVRLCLTVKRQNRIVYLVSLNEDIIQPVRAAEGFDGLYQAASDAPSLMRFFDRQVANLAPGTAPVILPQDVDGQPTDDGAVFFSNKDQKIFTAQQFGKPGRRLHARRLGLEDPLDRPDQLDENLYFCWS